MGKKIIQGGIEFPSWKQSFFINSDGLEGELVYCDCTQSDNSQYILTSYDGSYDYILVSVSSDGTLNLPSGFSIADGSPSYYRVGQKQVDYEFLYSSAGSKILVEDLNDQALISIDDQGYLKLQNLVDPQNELDAATKKYVDIVNLENQANTNERFRQLYDLLQLIDITTTATAEEIFKGVSITIPETLTMDDGWTYKVIDGAGARINEFKGNTWMKNQLVDYSTAWFNDKANKGVTFTVNKTNGTISMTGTATAGGNENFNEIPQQINHIYIIYSDKMKVNFTGAQIEATDTAKMVRATATQNGYAGVGLIEGQTYNIQDATFKLVDLTKMFGAGKEPTSIAEFNRLIANINFDGYDSGTVINTNLSELKSYSQYVSYTFTGNEKWVTWGSGKRANVTDIPTSVNDPTYGKCEVVNWIANRGDIYSGANLNGISNTQIDSVTNFVVGGNVDVTSLTGKTIYYQPQNPTDAELLGTYQLSIPILNGFNDTQDNINKDGYYKRIGSYTFTGEEPIKLTNWQAREGTYGVGFNYSTIPNFKQPIDGSTPFNGLCADLPIISYSEAFNNTIGICSYSNTNIGILIRVPTSIATDNATLLNWLKGKTLYYELANPHYYNREGMVEVDLGTLNWSYQEDHERFYTTELSDIVVTNEDTTVSGDIQSDAFTPIGLEHFKDNDKAICIYKSNVFIKDIQYNTVEDLKQSLSGIIVTCKPNETPTTKTYFDPLLIPIEVNGNIILRSKAAPETIIEFAIGEGE